LSERQGLAAQADQQERGEQRRRHLLRVRRRSNRSSVVSHRDDRARSKVHGKLSLHKIRHRVRIKGYGSARRRRGHLWAQLSKASLEEALNQDRVSRSRLRPVGDRRVKRAAKEKEPRALMVSRLRHNSASNRSSVSRAVRVPQPIRNRVAGSRKAGKEDSRDKRHRQGSNNFGASNTSGSGI
jgi:hypothetical protein